MIEDTENITCTDEHCIAAFLSECTIRNTGESFLRLPSQSIVFKNRMIKNVNTYYIYIYVSIIYEQLLQTDSVYCGRLQCLHDRCPL